MRRSTPVGPTLRRGIVAVVLTLCCATSPAQTSSPTAKLPAGPGSLSGVWQSGSAWLGGNGKGTLGSLRIAEGDRVQRTIDGKRPEMLPWAAELLEKRIGMSQRGEPFVSTMVQCLPGMPVLMLGGPYHIQILETPGLVTILLEEQNHFRLIYLNGKHPEDPDPTFMGHSVGHWDGNTLVVDTIGFTDRTPIDRVGMPHTDALHLIERYRRVDKDTIELVMTIDDPKTFPKPWDAKVIYHAMPPGEQLSEYICENNRDYAGAASPASAGAAK
jgi:hypothetical protein